MLQKRPTCLSMPTSRPPHRPCFGGRPVGRTPRLDASCDLEGAEAWAVSLGGQCRGWGTPPKSRFGLAPVPTGWPQKSRFGLASVALEVLPKSALRAQIWMGISATHALFAMRNGPATGPGPSKPGSSRAAPHAPLEATPVLSTDVGTDSRATLPPDAGDFGTSMELTPRQFPS